MSEEKPGLPIPVLDHPRWRVNIRPFKYIENRIQSLRDCFNLIENHRVRLRGWDYPYINRDTNGVEYGKTWISSWENFDGHIEYWRFFQSGQFLHLFAIREMADSEWADKLRSRASRQIVANPSTGWDDVPGFISIPNFLYTISEIFEFAGRLAQAGIYKDQLEIRIELLEIKGFILLAGEDRAWSGYYASGDSNLPFKRGYSAKELIERREEFIVETSLWFFERFGWINASKSIIKSDVHRFLTGYCNL